MDIEYCEMTAAELERELEGLLDRLDDTELLRGSVLGQTGNHVSGGYVKRFDEELSEINEKIALVRKAIEAKKQNG